MGRKTHPAREVRGKEKRKQLKLTRKRAADQAKAAALSGVGRAGRGYQRAPGQRGISRVSGGRGGRGEGGL
jgi:hypothetical protein